MMTGNNFNTPCEIAQKFCSTGIEKSNIQTKKLIILSIIGGIFIGLGGLLTIVVAGGMPETYANNPGLIKFISGALFPVGLIMVSVAGADLFTSDCAIMSISCVNKNTKFINLLKVLIISYLFNFIGTQFVAYFMTIKTGLLSSNPWSNYMLNYAYSKINQDFSVVLIKGIGANILVCLGTWMGYSAKDTSGKVLGIWFPVMLFVTLGYEHSIANMFFIPTAIYLGSDITWMDFFVKNLIPSTIGNVIGGALVGITYGYVYRNEAK